MNFNRHFELEGLHAFLGPSKYHWLNYSEEKMADSYLNFLAGTERNRAACVRCAMHSTGTEITQINKNTQHVCKRCNWLSDDSRATTILFGKLFWDCGCHFVSKRHA